jgi:hypothetical protein
MQLHLAAFKGSRNRRDSCLVLFTGAGMFFRRKLQSFPFPAKILFPAAKLLESVGSDGIEIHQADTRSV